MNLLFPQTFLEAMSDIHFFYMCMSEEERAGVDLFEYLNRPPPPPKVQSCYVSIPAGPDFYIPELDGDDSPAEIKRD